MSSALKSRRILGEVQSSIPGLKASAVKAPPTSRYAQGVYNPGRKHQVEVLEKDEENSRMTKRSKTSSISSGSRSSTSTTSNHTVTNVVGAAKQSLKEKQLLKERRLKKTGISAVRKAPVQSDELTRFSSIQAERRDSRYSQSRDSIVLDSCKSLLVDLDPIRPAVTIKTNVPGPLKIVHVARASSMIKKSSLLQLNTNGGKEMPLRTVSRIPTKTLIPQTVVVKIAPAPRRRKSKRLALVQDPLLVQEYELDIYLYLREVELTTLPDPHYMFNQPELDWGMRRTLVAWILQVHGQFKLLPETLYLTINLIDRCLSLKSISLSKLQLVGVTALLIASKYEEILAPSVQDLVYMTDYSYEADEILKAERHMLGILAFQLGYPNPLNFLKRLGVQEPKAEALSHYFLEVMLLGNQFLQYPSSLLAGAAFFLSMKTIHNGNWTNEYVSLIGYTEASLLPCVYALLQYLNTDEYEMVFEKYNTPAFFGVSLAMRSFLSSKR